MARQPGFALLSTAQNASQTEELQPPEIRRKESARCSLFILSVTATVRRDGKCCAFYPAQAVSFKEDVHGEESSICSQPGAKPRQTQPYFPSRSEMKGTLWRPGPCWQVGPVRRPLPRKKTSTQRTRAGARVDPWPMIFLAFHFTHFKIF